MGVSLNHLCEAFGEAGNDAGDKERPRPVHRTKGQVSAHLNLTTHLPLEPTDESPEMSSLHAPPHPPTYLASPASTVMISYLADFHFQEPWNPPSSPASHQRLPSCRTILIKSRKTALWLRWDKDHDTNYSLTLYLATHHVKCQSLVSIGRKLMEHKKSRYAWISLISRQPNNDRKENNERPTGNNSKCPGRTSRSLRQAQALLRA